MGWDWMIKKANKKSAKTVKKSIMKKPSSKKPVLLSGGNPQIAKEIGDAPVQAYIEALSDWKYDIAKRLDDLIAKHIPHSIKAVKWNSPFYGLEGQGWIIAFHTFNKYIKVSFFHGIGLEPIPPGGTSKEARWVDIRENEFDEKQIIKWIKQAADLPGWGKI